MYESARDAAAALIDGRPSDHASIIRTLRKFGNAALRYALERGIRVVPLVRGQRYQERSEALHRLAIDVDAWPAPPAGLFVVEERTMYLRSRSAMTVAHEFGHALDCALGEGMYRSSVDPVLRRLFSEAQAFVTPYAATGTDEYFAESLRAYVEANDTNSFWPRATRERLRRIDPEMYAYVESFFLETFRLPREPAYLNFCSVGVPS
jgi:hypothetical protein